MRAAIRKATRGPGKDSIVTEYRSGQIARYTAVVLAGTASLTLTFAAGAYVVRQIPDTRQPSEITSDRAASPIALRDVTRSGPSAAAAPRTDDLRDRPVFLFGSRADEPVASPLAPQASSTPPSTDRMAVAPERPVGVSGRVDVGSAYVGAHFAPTRNSVAFTVDTNLFSTLSEFLGSEQFRDDFGTEADPSGITAVRTEIDTRRGEVTFVLSDPSLGEHDLRLDRNPAPAAVPQDSPGTVAVQGDSRSSEAVTI